MLLLFSDIEYYLSFQPTEIVRNSAVMLGFVNHFKLGTISADSEVPGLGASNLSSDQCAPSRGWQTAAGITSATLTVAAATAGMLWRMFALVRTNFTERVTISYMLTSGGSAVWIGTAEDLVQNGYGQAVLVLPRDVTADALVLEVSDPTNPDGHLSVGGAFAGPAWNPSIGISWDSTYGVEVSQQEANSRGGQDYVTLFYRRRYWNLVMDAVRDSEAWDDLAELIRAASSGGNVLFVPDLGSVDIGREAVFGRLKTQSDVSFPNKITDARHWSAQVTERL